MRMDNFRAIRPTVNALQTQLNEYTTLEAIKIGNLPIGHWKNEAILRRHWWILSLRSDV